jgi:hypothetical protein
VLNTSDTVKSTKGILKIAGYRRFRARDMESTTLLHLYLNLKPETSNLKHETSNLKPET